MSAPGVVLVHDRFGLTPHVRDYADELVMAGFAVETVDLFGGATASDPAGAQRLADALDDVPALASIGDAGRRLRDAGAPAVGAVGFSLGGFLVLRAAALGDVDAVVAYDATRPPADAATTSCPVQLHLTEEDGGAPGDVAAYVAGLEAAGTPVDTFTYAGPVRSWAHADVPHLDPGASDAARARTIGFLHARLSA